jgi:copper homeostasis protein
MLMDAKLMLENGADGIVFGFLHEDGSIDVERTKELVQLIHPKKAVYNKAADKTKDIIESVGILVECGVDRILTSGGAPYLDESKGSLEDINKGIETIKKLQELYGDKIEIMPGSGIREHNIERILTTTNTHCVHMAARGKILDPSSTHYMPKSDSIENYKYVGVSEEVLKRLLAKVEAISA